LGTISKHSTEEIAVNTLPKNSISTLAMVFLVSIAGCAGMSETNKDTAYGAGAGAVAGAVVTGGSPTGTAAGAAVGGLIGRVIGSESEKKKKE
jgi:osmotically inducible lipoprotein OsmB